MKRPSLRGRVPTALIAALGKAPCEIDRPWSTDSPILR